MMSAPLLGPDRLLGTITVQSTAANAFDAGRRRAAEAAGRPGRHRADQRPPVRRGRGVRAPLPPPRRQLARHRVERRRRRPLHVLLRLARGAHRLEAGASCWAGRSPASLRRGRSAAAHRRLGDAARDPDREQRVRLDLPLPDGRMSQTEVAMTGTIVDGRFAGRARLGPRHQRARAAGGRPARPGRRAGGQPGARAPRARAARLGDAGPVQHGSHAAHARDPAGDRSRRRRAASWWSCASSRRTHWPRCGR